MNNFILDRVTAYGPLGKTSIIDLKPGVNIISGPSNTGKTMVVACIDYLFGGSKEPFDPSVEGYNKVSIRLVNENGEPLTVYRDIPVNEGNAGASTKVTISSAVEGIDGGEYNLKKTKDPDEKIYGDIVLQMLGICEPVKIISNQNGKPNRLTPRTFFHQFCIKEDDIFRDGPIIDNPGHSSITSCVNALAYLLYEGGVQDGEYEDPTIKKAKKSAVISYISSKMSTLSNKQEELKNKIEEAGTADVEGLIARIIDEISSVDEEITKAQAESQKLLGDIYEVTDSLMMEQQLKERYNALHTQYDSDVSRLRFIIEGEEKAVVEGDRRCPFCNSEIADPDERESYIAASKAELEKVYLQIADLEALENETDDNIKSFRNRLDSLNAKNGSVKNLIAKEFAPRAASLRSELRNYRKVVQLKQGFEALQNLASDFDFDIAKRASEDEETDKYDAKEAFDKAVFAKLSSAVGNAIKECNYPGYRVAGLSPSNFDVVVNNKEKRHEGKGYKAFLNSLYAFVLMKFIEEEGEHAPKMLILDSPILSLKEDVDIPATDSMKTSLLNYIIDNCGSCQVLIAENDLPEKVKRDKANIIEFSREAESARKGFLIKD